MNSPHDLILVTGGTGKTGSRICKRLKKAGIPFRVGSRTASPAFDWYDRSTWSAALDGCGAVYVAFQPDVSVPGALEILSAFFNQALAQDVRRIVLLSGRGEPEAVDAEDALKQRPADWTILRASWFNQNFTEGFRDWIAAGHLALPVQPIPEPFIDADDIADVAVAALTQPGHSGKLYELTGPRALTYAEAVAEIAKATGRDIAFSSISPEEFRRIAAKSQMPDEITSLMLYLFSTVADGRNRETCNGVREALGRPARGFSEFVREQARLGAWNANVGAAA